MKRPGLTAGSGMRVPHRYIGATESTGRTIYEVERVEVGVEPAPDTVTIGATSALPASVPRP